MMIDEAEARAIAGRWGKVADSGPLVAFAETGLIEDRKKLKEAIGGIRLFLKHTEELDRLEAFVDHPCPSERAARREGWSVEGDKIFHVHDYDHRVSYKTWDECCRGEDIASED
jgi:hypothetical protein